MQVEAKIIFVRIGEIKMKFRRARLLITQGNKVVIESNNAEISFRISELYQVESNPYHMKCDIVMDNGIKSEIIAKY